MGKKLIGIAVIAIMLFGVFGLTACTESLDDYKVKGKASIDAHVATKTQNDYSTDKWAELLNAAADGKQTVENATNKGEVDTAVDNTKIEINAVKKKAEMADVISIHYYTTESFKAWQDHKFYDFTARTFSTKRVVAEWEEDWEEYGEEYTVRASFTEEKANAFFQSVKEIGIYDLEKNYHDDDLLDGWDWKLVITLSDGTVFESGGYVKYPEQEEALNEAFLALTGYNLFTPLWSDFPN